MPSLKKVWDRKGGESGKGGFVEMYSLSAKEAIKTHPDRYSLDQPAAAQDETPAKGKQKEA